MRKYEVLSALEQSPTFKAATPYYAWKEGSASPTNISVWCVCLNHWSDAWNSWLPLMSKLTKSPPLRTNLKKPRQWIYHQHHWGQCQHMIERWKEFQLHFWNGNINRHCNHRSGSARTMHQNTISSCDQEWGRKYIQMYPFSQQGSAIQMRTIGEN